MFALSLVWHNSVLELASTYFDSTQCFSLVIQDIKGSFWWGILRHAIHLVPFSSILIVGNDLCCLSALIFKFKSFL